MGHGSALADSLSKLAKLRAEEVLSEGEFQELKARAIKGALEPNAPSTPQSLRKPVMPQRSSGGGGFTLLTILMAIFLPLAIAAYRVVPSFGLTLAPLVIALAVLLIPVCIYLYFLPSIIAFRRQHPNRIIILILNFLFGITVLGWLLLLVWAFRAAHLSAQGNGGESGLNIYSNDTQNVKITTVPTNQQENYAEHLSTLGRLRAEGALTETEFAQIKQNILAQI